MLDKKQIGEIPFFKIKVGHKAGKQLTTSITHLAQEN